MDTQSSQDPLDTEAIGARIEAFRAAQLETAKDGDLAAVCRVAALVSRALALLERLTASTPEDADRIVEALSELSRDPLPAPDLPLRQRAFDAIAKSYGVGVDDLGELPSTPRRAGPVLSPKAKARRRKLRALIVFALGTAVVPLIFHLSSGPNPVFDVAAKGSGRPDHSADGPQLTDGYSNIYAKDYVGVDACRECHEKKWRGWRKHPHSRMNQNARPETVLGDFNDASARYADMDVHLDQEGETYRMTLLREGKVLRRYRVTRTVGSRFTQHYIGLQTEGPEPKEHPIYSAEGKLPFGYWLTRDRWFPVNYFDSDFAPDYGADGTHESVVVNNTRLHRWERSCIFCHNTYPYARRLSSGLKETLGFPAEDLRLEPAPTPTPKLPSADLLGLGIGCESCHFGGREHASSDKGEVPMRFVPSAPDLVFPAASKALVKDGQQTPYVINSICAQCHAARVTRYPNGSSTWNSSEAHDMLASACAGEIKCTDCHDPHKASPPGGSPDKKEHIEACMGCHEGYETKSHTNHETVSCLDCHMPRMVQGLDTVIRTHRISSPTDPEMLRQAAPNACNLCHLDQSISWTLAELDKGWDLVIPTSSEWTAAYGDLDTPVGKTWLRHEVPITRLISTAAYGRSRLGQTALPSVLESLEDPNPVNRVFGMFAVEAILGRRLAPAEYEPTDPPAARRLQVSKLRSALR